MKSSIAIPKRNFKSQTALNQLNTFNSNVDFKFNNIDFINPNYFKKGESFIKKEKTEVSFSDSVDFLDDYKKTTEKKILNDVYKKPQQQQDFNEKKIQKILDLPRKLGSLRSSKKAPQSSKRITSLDKTNTNVYFWYFKNIKCERDSCKAKKEEKRSKSEYPRSILKEQNKNKIDTKIRELIESAESEASSSNYTEYLNKFKRKGFHISQTELDRYKNEQEMFNSKYFVRVENVDVPPPTERQEPESFTNDEKKKTKNYFYDLDKRTPTPEVTIEPKKKGVRLTIAQLRTLELSQKFYKDAKNMLFFPDSNSFEAKGRKFFLEY
jgi:hypothetical protein